jgi:3-hydroxyacyl-[acyl-carrier-protein] dehydratase
MPSALLVPLAGIDLDRIQYGPDEIHKFNPQRFEMEQLHGIVHMDLSKAHVVGVREVRDDEFWVRGHIPGRPLMPGVLMLEAAAQLCSFLFKHAVPQDPDRFLGFAGIDGVKFRGAVVPGDRLVLMAAGTELRPRRAIFQTQGVVKDRLVFEATIIGMPV